GGVNQRKCATQGFEGAEETVGVAEYVLTGNEMIPLAQQGREGGCQRRHAGSKIDAAYPLLQQGDLGLECARGGRTLPRVRIAAAGSLKHAHQVVDIV